MKAHTMNTVWLTSRGMRQLQAEHERLKATVNSLRRDLRQANLDFEEEVGAKKLQEQQVAQSKLERLERLLQRVRPVRIAKSDTARLGSQVTYLRDETVNTIRLVGSPEADPSEGFVSLESPLGSALMGRRAGDVTFMVTPIGERKFHILEVK